MHSFPTTEALVADRRAALAADASRLRLGRIARRVRRQEPRPPRSRTE